MLNPLSHPGASKYFKYEYKYVKWNLKNISIAPIKKYASFIKALSWDIGFLVVAFLLWGRSAYFKLQGSLESIWKRMKKKDWKVSAFTSPRGGNVSWNFFVCLFNRWNIFLCLYWVAMWMHVPVDHGQKSVGNTQVGWRCPVLPGRKSMLRSWLYMVTSLGWGSVVVVSFLIFFLKISLFILEREREHEQEGQRERGRENPMPTPHWAHRARHGGSNPGPWDHDLSWIQGSSQTLNWPHHPGSAVLNPGQSLLKPIRVTCGLEYFPKRLYPLLCVFLFFYFYFLFIFIFVCVFLLNLIMWVQFHSDYVLVLL